MALFAGLAVAMAACRAPEPAGLEPDTFAPRPIVVASAVDMRGVNELVVPATSFHTALHYYALFLTLLDEQPDFEKGPPELEPRLAESYELGADGRTLTFELRRDAVWSDGEPITAEDVRWTWQAQTHPDVAWPLAGFKRHVRDVEVAGPHTVRFHFDRAYATQLLDANLGVILPKHAWSRLPFAEWRRGGAWFVDHLVVSGPFDLESWQPGERIVLRRNPRYCGAQESAAQKSAAHGANDVVFRITPDRSAQLALLRSGEAHVADWVRPADARILEHDDDLVIKSYLPRGSRALVWNLAHPLFKSREVRRALTYALDREAIAETVYHGWANVSDTPYTSNVWARNRALTPWPYDPRRAREILAAEGWSDHDGDGVLDREGRPFSFEILTVAGNELREDALVMVQDQLGRLGVEVRQTSLEFNSLVARERRHDFDVTFSSLGVGTDLDLSYFFHSEAIEDGYNVGAYANPEVDAVLDELEIVGGRTEAKPLYDRLQALIYEDLPITILYEPMLLVPVRKELRGVSPNSLSTYWHLEDWRIGE